jgi:acyl carrier protein
MAGDISERIQRLFVEALNVEVASEDADLIDCGVIDSLALVELIFAIEREFDLTLPFDELEIETFRSVRSISEFIAASKTPAGGPVG